MRAGLASCIARVTRVWIEFLRTHLGSTTGQVGGLSLPPVVRIPAAVVLIVWGALKSKFWTIPVAMALATPVFGAAALVAFAGLPRLLAHETRKVRELDAGQG